MPRLGKDFDNFASGMDKVLTNIQDFNRYGQEYYRARRLNPKVASALYLMFFGVATVISGQYGSWNFGLVYGFGGMVAAFVIATAIFWILSCTIAELASLMPFTGGSSNFATAAFGPLAGVIEGYCFYSELITFASSSLMTLSGWFCEAFGLTQSFQPIFWVVIIASSFFVFMDLRVFLRINAVMCCISILLLFVYTGLNIPHMVNYAEKINHENLFPDGTALDIFYALPYGIWFYVGVEVIPFLSEETISPTKDIPSGLIQSMAVLTAASIPILLIVPGSGAGIVGEANAQFPLAESLRITYSLSKGSPLDVLVHFIYLSGYICSFLGATLGAQRSMYALSRAGLFPDSLSLTIQRQGFGKGTPYLAVGVTFVIVVVFAAASLAAGDVFGNFLILMCIFYALISYTFTFFSFIRIRYRLHESFERPFRSPFGKIGALFGSLLSVTGLVSVITQKIQNKTMRFAVFAVIIQIVFGIIYYFLVLRYRIGFIPEKLFIQAQLQEMVESKKAVQRRKSRASDGPSVLPEGKSVGISNNFSNNSSQEDNRDQIQDVDGQENDIDVLPLENR